MANSRTVAICIVALTGLLLLQQRVEVPLRGAWGSALQNFLHVPWFALVTTLLLSLLRAPPSSALSQRWRIVRGAEWLYFIGGLLTLAVGSEVLQAFTGRDGEMQDVVRDMLGAGAVLLGYAAWHLRGHWRWVAGLTAVALVCAGSWQLGELSVGLIARNAGLPVLLDPTQHFSRMFVQPHAAHTLPTQGDALRLRLQRGAWSGFILDEPYPDWRGYQRLCLQLDVADGQPLPLLLRIHDAPHERGAQTYGDRFNSEWTLQPGHNLIDIPLAEVAGAPRTRPMQMDRIANIGVYASAPMADGRLLDVGRIWLTRALDCGDDTGARQ